MSKLAQVLKSHTDINGITLYEHINTFLYEVLQSNHKDMNSIELLSDFTKKNRFFFKKLASESEVNNLHDHVPDFASWVRSVSQLLQGQAVAEMPTILQDFVASARLLEAAGYGFGEEESYQIQLRIKQLSIETQATELAFFGKILCRNQDYYVARGVVPKLPTDHLPPNVEPRGDGVNFYTFWVTNDILADWNELPLVTPEQIRAAREIKYICSGDLNHELKTYPPFPGKEKHYLKAQLVRILHANLIAPKGLYKPKDEQPKELEFEEEFKMPEFTELANPETWVHVPSMILKQGRISLYMEGLNEEAKTALQEADPEVERLKGIAEDRPLEPFYQTNWLVKIIGDQMMYQPKDENSGNNVYATVVLKNYTWSGALTVANQNLWAFLYLGYGFKDTQAAYAPIQNNDLQQEPEDKNEFPEPNPKNPPKPPVPEGQEGQEGQEQQEGQDQQADADDQ